ncbi:MAG: Na/Pi symporter [Bacteroidetes bacterium]|nr:Na/Pi symporter [Bacteroidota bacterium]
MTILPEGVKYFYNKHKNLFAGLQLILFLYLFMFSLDLMGASLKMFGKDFANTLIETTTNPFIGLFIGILATSVIQSSSSTTSIVVGMVAAGALNIENAIPIVMGANIGTSVTTFLAAFPQINRGAEFKRAFAAATVHDFFNIMSVILLLPLQINTNFLGISAGYLGEKFQNVGGLTFLSPVKAMTKPLVLLIKDLVGPDLPWLMLIIALGFLFASLKYMVDSLKILVVSKAKSWFDKILFKTSLRSFLVGLILTVMVQSSSITVSLMVPMAGAGILTLFQIFPYTLGANIGTTVTAILAALITGNPAAIVVAFSHSLFNICGLIIWWPLKKIPIFIAQRFAELSTKNKLIPVGFVVFTFFLMPILVIYLF